MIRKGRRFASLFFAFAALCAGVVDLHAETCPTGVFWCGTEEGTERQFNPASMIVNDGFDILQLEGHGNGLDTLFRAADARRLAGVLGHPVRSIERAGWGDFLGTEVVPTSLRPSRAAWIPNYQLHLVGGGMLNARAEDWYRAQGCEHPFWPALATSYTAYLLNETIEIHGLPSDHPTDPVADLFLFDAAGIALFRLDAVRSFFTSTVQLLNWPLQPSLGLDGRTLENTGQYFALKAPVGSGAWSLFYHFGLGNIGGVSRGMGGGNALSAAAGAYARRVDPVDRTTNRVTMAPKFGLFWDRDNSLLASLFWNSQSVERLALQLYPGAVPTGPVPLGGWISFDDGARPHGGITTVWGFGAATSRRPGR